MPSADLVRGAPDSVVVEVLDGDAAARQVGQDQVQRGHGRSHGDPAGGRIRQEALAEQELGRSETIVPGARRDRRQENLVVPRAVAKPDRKSTRLNYSHRWL